MKNKAKAEAISILLALAKTCLKCGHSWLSRVEQPKECPNCKSRAWDKDGN